jgi:hypothetical protein
MREPVTAERLQEFMKALADAAKSVGRVYLVGGATSVLLGWRSSTVDVDLKFVPETDEILRSLPALKERLQINIELASPGDFIPELPGWQERSRFVQQEGKLSFYHYDFYAQALAKIERRHSKDLQDVRELLANGLVEPERLLNFFSTIEDQIYKYPDLDAQSFRRAVEGVVEQAKRESEQEIQ